MKTSFKKGDILVPNGKFKQSNYHKLIDLKEVVVTNIVSYGLADCKILKGSISHVGWNDYFAKGQIVRLNTKAFKKLEDGNEYQIY